MTTIPQRLREIAVRIGTHDMAAYVQLRAIAAELEVPAADAVPVVAYIQHHKAGDNLVWDHPGGTASALVWESAHRLTVAALEARINELESRQAQPKQAQKESHWGNDWVDDGV